MRTHTHTPAAYVHRGWGGWISLGEERGVGYQASEVPKGLMGSQAGQQSLASLLPPPTSQLRNSLQAGELMSGRGEVPPWPGRSWKGRDWKNLFCFRLSVSSSVSQLEAARRGSDLLKVTSSLPRA